MGFTAVWLLACLAIGAVGLYFVIVGRRGTAKGTEVRRNWHRTTGKVLELRTRYPNRVHREPTSQPWYMPVVEFALPDGRVVQAESLTGGRPAPAKVGAVVPIYVDPDDPLRVMVDKGMAGPGKTGTGFTVLGALAMTFAFVGVGLWYLLVQVMGIPVG